MEDAKKAYSPVKKQKKREILINMQDLESINEKMQKLHNDSSN